MELVSQLAKKAVELEPVERIWSRRFSIALISPIMTSSRAGLPNQKLDMQLSNEESSMR